MRIHISTDKNIHGGDSLFQRLEGEFEAALSRFLDWVTRLDVHLGRETTADAVVPDRRCVLEAHPAGHPPIVVTHHAESVEEACQGAARKLQSALESKYDRAYHHKGGESIRHPKKPADAN
jgi:hypothetical protein